MLLGYWVLCVAANPSDPYSMTGYFGRNIDIAILGKHHMLHGDTVNGQMYHFDYEGLTSSIAAIAQVIFGYIAGNYILSKGKTAEMLNGLFVAGAVLMFCGLAWDMSFPIIKKIWSSSYTVYTTGLALIVLGIMMYLIEFKNATGWLSRFFEVFGKNALFIFVLSGLLPRLWNLIRIPNGVDKDGNPIYLNPWTWMYEHMFKGIASAEPRAGSAIQALCFIIFMWSLVWWLDKKKIYIKV